MTADEMDNNKIKIWKGTNFDIAMGITYDVRISALCVVTNTGKIISGAYKGRFEIIMWN
jgi:hypothetical protein